ncbi:hypothetical protein F66182_6334 [Fusarium sp. NRRL 66182]|nr:hypothetical protein F66182_6334 [Fusarium sp. NRRL 66182]
MASLDADNANVAVVIAAFISLALYNVLELHVHIFGSFKKRSGLYFWSFVIATWGIAFNATGFLVMHLELSSEYYLYNTLILIGWCTMITGQSVVLYSRLHMVMHNERLLRAVLYMIITNATWLHISIITLVYGIGSSNPTPFMGPYGIFEKIQLSIFFVQELIISGLYVLETLKRLKLERSIGNTKTQMVLHHLLWVNLFVILLDISILALEFADLYEIQTAWKPLVYSIKLKIEFSILNRLVDMAQAGRAGRGGSSYVQSQAATHADEVGLETVNAERGNQLQNVSGQCTGDYEVHVRKGADGDPVQGYESSLAKTTAAAVHSQRYPSRDDHHKVSSADRSPGSLGQTRGMKRRSASSSASASSSSEIQFARYNG